MESTVDKLDIQVEPLARDTLQQRVYDQVAAHPHQAALDFGLTINQPPPCLTGFLPASQWRAPGGSSLASMSTS